MSRDELFGIGIPEHQLRSNRFVLDAAGTVIPLRPHALVVGSVVYIETPGRHETASGRLRAVRGLRCSTGRDDRQIEPVRCRARSNRQ
jgi:hypothetical protein